MRSGLRRWSFIGSVLILLAIVGFVAASAQSATVVRVEDTEIDADSTGEVVVGLENVTEIVAMHIEIVYDPDLLVWQEFEQGDLLAGSALVEANTESPGRVILGFATLDGVASEGELIVATFEATDEEASTTIDLENVQAWDSNGFDVLIDAQSGQVTVESAFPDWLLILILAAICLFLLIIAIVVLIWFLRRRRRRSEEPQSTMTEPNVPAAQPQPAPQAQATENGQPNFCSNCGQSLRPGVAFCSNCGESIRD
ncbi:MAG: cohesin domain-containing protein [Thermomicrobiales bacterium]